MSEHQGEMKMVHEYIVRTRGKESEIRLESYSAREAAILVEQMGHRVSSVRKVRDNVGQVKAD